MPAYAYPGDAGLDLYTPDEVTILPGERKQIPLGLAIEFPAGYTAIFFEKSGLSHKHGLISLGGVFDSGYRGEYRVCIMNSSDVSYTFAKGDKIIQLLVLPLAQADIIESDELSESERGTGAFGSSGK